ncbi:unnamed protein product [Parnassius apollo]|uniref:(apollo) hypothetical protein n=1 Tax=Parnassius apollo TaxID=110799 RepID=A0A8S3WKA8_PARAO|nr:unnamed protein product [Parnassius apollo]
MLRSPTTTYSSSPNLMCESEQNPTTQRKRKQPNCELMQGIIAIRSDLKSALSEFSRDLDSKLEKINGNIYNTRTDLDSCKTEMRKEINQLRLENSTLKTQTSVLSSEVENLQQSLQFSDAEHSNLKKRFDEITTVSHATNKKNAILLLEEKIDSIDQQARQFNLEISNVPEKNGENLLSLLIGDHWQNS